MSARSGRPGRSAAGRRAWFFLLERVVLPLCIPPLRLLVASWRTPGGDAIAVDALADVPRLVIVTWHGMLFRLLPYAPILQRRNRRLLVMVSPSLDGRLLAALLRRFGIDHVRATRGSRGIGGSLEFARRIAAGDIGIVAADGPIGPRRVPTPGVLRVARLAGAELVAAVVAGGATVRAPSWDRTELPAPFALGRLSLLRVRADATLDDLQRALATS